MMMAMAAVAGYFGVSRWVSYPFIPARLLWLVPALSLLVALGIASLNRRTFRYGAVLAILLSYVSSAFLYFRRENFLNLGYVAPLPEIAALLNREAQPEDLILMDAYNTDYHVLAAQLSGRTPHLVLHQRNLAAARLQLHSAATVWIARNTRDVSPGHITTEVQSEACAGRVERDIRLVPLAPWQRAAAKLAGIEPPLTHFYQVTRCGPGAASGTGFPARPARRTAPTVLLR
jgi:hypothetical protein